MSSSLALYMGLGLIAWMLRADLKWRQVGSKLLLIPFVWLAIQGSRPVSYWFGSGAADESNTVNTVIFAILIGSMLLVVSNRGLRWGEFFKNNRALCAVYLYLAITAIWSDAPLTSLKRLLKDFGCVLLPLLLLMQPNAMEVVRAIFVRVSYVLFPLSVIFIKYFPHIGRSFSKTGEPMFGGVTIQKNSLGEVVLVFGLMLLWDLVEIYRDEKRQARKAQLYIRFGMLLMGIWLLLKCDSQTSLLCLLIGSTVYFGSKWLTTLRHGKRILISCLVGALLLVVLDKTFGLSSMVIRALGRDPSLTGRTEIWRIVLNQKTDPILGVGFYSFWDSKRGQAVMDEFMQINSAHNGYLEMYVDGGLIGVFLLGVFLLVAGGRTIDRLFSGHPLGSIGLTFWVIAIIYNASESSFFKLDPLWLVLILVTVEFPISKAHAISLATASPRRTKQRQFENPAWAGHV
jgi:exopolysaccharide production protein ExoQ